MSEISDRIRATRIHFRCTQERFGRYAGVSKSAVSQWEIGHTTPERDALLALQKSLHINPDYIISGKGKMIFDGDEIAGVRESAEIYAAHPIVSKLYIAIRNEQLSARDIDILSTLIDSMTRAPAKKPKDVATTTNRDYLISEQQRRRTK